MKRISLLLCLTATLSIFWATANKASSPTGNSNSRSKVAASAAEGDELQRARALVRVINQYRRQQGLDEIPYSPWLTRVARWHVYDLEVNRPSDQLGAGYIKSNPTCNLHSWSNKGGIKGLITISGPPAWSPCCYAGDPAQGKCIWDKPREISNGAYRGNGYEIAAVNTGKITNDIALRAWEGSPSHLSVIINRGKWGKYEWRAIGAAISHHYAVVWFSDDADTSD